MRFHILYVLAMAFVLPTYAQIDETGTPFVRNFFPADYNGHTQNFDIAEDAEGSKYVANFAGVLVFNGQDWTLVLTPDISRVTRVETDNEGRVFVGGLHEIGMISTTEDGKHQYHDLRPLIPEEGEDRFGEIMEIKASNGKIFFFARKQILIYDGESIEQVDFDDRLASAFSFGANYLLRSEDNDYYSFNPESGKLAPLNLFEDGLEISDVLDLGKGTFLMGTAETGLMLFSGNQLSPFPGSINERLVEARISDLLKVSDDLLAIGTPRGGVYFVRINGEVVTHVDRNYGLQNDYVNKLYLDSERRLWAALNNGISIIGYPWPWTSYSRNNGLKAGVVSLVRNNGNLLAGTYQGLYKLNRSEQEFYPIEGIETACWQFLKHGDYLLGATSAGIYKIEDEGVTKLTDEFTLCMASFEDKPGYVYAGTLDGFSEISLSESGDIQSNVAKFGELGEVTGLIADEDGNLWVATLNGQLARYNVTGDRLKILGEEQNLPDLLGNQFYEFDNNIIAGTTEGLMRYNNESGTFESYEINADTSNGAIAWPGLIHSSTENSFWITRGDETGLSYYVRENGNWKYVKEAFGPFQDFICRSIYDDPSGVKWFGGPSGLIRYDAALSKDLPGDPKAMISGIRLNNDSLLYGGFGPGTFLSDKTASLKYNYRNVSFEFASTGYNVQSEVEYSFWLKGHDRKWSEWNAISEKEYQKISPGTYTFYLRSKDIYGNVSEPVTFRFEVRFPWYMKWYMILVYVLALGYGIWQIVQLRLRNLVKEKEKLENTVRERTSEIREQRDEIQKKSEELTHALSDLRNTQEELIRQEKLASVGQMTKGIVDRIINPLNYINNFSSLSRDLANDMKEVLEDEKASISEDNYDELLDISSMLELNLGKIQDHGGNTVRIVKGMEELLKDRTGRFTSTDVSELVRQVLKRINSSFEEEINTYGVEVDIQLKGDDFEANVINEELSKAVYELFDNAMQSVVANSQKNKSLGAYVRGELEATDGQVTLSVKDNGMGIPEKEMGQIFDPFFTTKPTAKGSGVGLYLVREIIYLHRGTITVSSEVNKETVFTIVLPKAKN